MIFYFPLKLKVITQHFDGRPEVYSQFGMKSHGGLDWRAATGTEVYAMNAGTVKEVGDQGTKGYGKYVKIQHQTCESVYAHFSRHVVKKGDVVEAGQCIGISGNTGFSTASHLHTAVRQTDTNGSVLHYDNGWKGYIDFEKFLVDKLPEPVTPQTIVDEAEKEAILQRARQKRQMWSGAFNKIKSLFTKP